MKRVLITGISGFIGQALAQRLKSRGYSVAGISRSPSKFPIDRIIQKSLGESIQEILSTEKFDAIIHGAHFMGPNEVEINIQGTKLWESEAQQASIPIQILIGSISAHQEIPTNYGRIKRELETWFTARQHYVLNPGLVVGNQGLFGKMRATIESQKIVPLLDQGKDPIFLTSLETFLKSVEVLLEGRLPRIAYFIHEPNPYPLREVLETLADMTKKEPLFFNVPSTPIYLGLKLLEKLRIPFPVASSSIRGLKSNAHFTQKTDLEKLNCQPKRLKQILEEIQ